MAITREQAILELLLEIGDTLKGFNEVERQYEQTISALRAATDKADIDRLSREALEARDSMQRLSEQGQKQLRKLADSGQLASNEYKELRGNVDRLERAIAEADRELAQFNRRGREVGGLTAGVRRLQSAWVAVGSVVASIGIARVLRTIFEETKQAEQAQAQIEQAIRSTGGASGATAADLFEMAKGLQAVTTFGDDTILGMQSLLLTFTSLRKQELPEISERVLDLATALAAGGGGGGQIDLRSAALAVGKAMQEPLKGATALQRQFRFLTEEQLAQIKVLVESNRLYDAQRVVLDALAVTVGGRARAAANTFAGAIQQAKNIAGDLAEEVGEQGLARELGILARLFSESAEGGSSLGRSLGQVLALAVRFAGTLVKTFETTRGAVALVIAGILAAARLLYSGLASVFGGIEGLVVGAIERIASAIPDVDLPGRTDDALRKWAGTVAAGFEAGRKEAETKREEIERELTLLTEGFVETAEERFEAARQIGLDLERIRKELEAAGEAAAGPLRTGLDEGAEGADKLGEGVGSAADEAARLTSELGGATSAVERFTEAADRVPATRFAADLELDEADITKELADVQARLEEIRSSVLIDPAEEQALLERESDLLLDLSRAQRAWTDVQVESNAAAGETAQRLQDLTGLQSSSTELWGEYAEAAREATSPQIVTGLGLTADALAGANAGFAAADDNLAGLVESGSEAAAVTLPALNQGLLDTARDSGALGASLEAIGERLLVTATNAEQQGQALGTMGEHGREAATATERLGESAEDAEQPLRQLGEAAAALGDERIEQALDRIEKRLVGIETAARLAAKQLAAAATEAERLARTGVDL